MLLAGRTPVTTLLSPGGHTFAVWAAQLPTVLTWISHHITTPAAAAPSLVPR